MLEQERKLDRMFATKAISPELLGKSLGEIASLQGRVRGAHLEAHLAEVQILTPEQNSQYARLRGYDSADANKGHGIQHKH